MASPSNENPDWEIKYLQDRYRAMHGLRLTVEQAKKVQEHEKHRDVVSFKNMFSDWEKLDYDLTTFREILTKKQLEKYEASQEALRKRYEQSMIEADKKLDHEIAYHEERIHFYQTELLPELLNDKYLSFSLRGPERTKIEFLRSEYKNFLLELKQETLVSHFRHNRTFSPNALKVSLLRHKLWTIIPDYFAFKHWMDEPTKASANFLKLGSRYIPEETDSLLKRKFEELHVFNEESIKKHYGENRGGWYVMVGKPDSEAERESQIMTLLLLDKDRYGF